MNTRAVVAMMFGTLLACSACGRVGEGTAEADALPKRFHGDMLPSTGTVPKPGSVTVTYLGTSMLLIDDGNTQLLLNPLLSRPIDPANAARPNAASIDAAMKQTHAGRIKAIFVSQADNRLSDATYIARKTGATLYGPDAALAAGRADGVPEDQLVAYKPDTTIAVGKFRIKQIASKAAPTKTGKPGTAGASSDFLISKGSKSLLVKSSTNFLPDALDHVNADVLFLATDALAEQTEFFQDLYYRQTVGQVHPELVIPLHWEDARRPLSRELMPSEGTPAAFDFLSARLQQDKIKFGLLQGYQTTELFDVRSCAVPMSAAAEPLVDKR
jgi:L-ascorbate metabolism protein UlaG (beta-lactamase superfamily)